MWGFCNVYSTNTDREWLDAFSFRAINRQVGGDLLIFPPAPISFPSSLPFTTPLRTHADIKYIIYIYIYKKPTKKVFYYIYGVKSVHKLY